MAAGLLAGAPDRVKEAPLAVRRHQGPVQQGHEPGHHLGPPRPGSWQRVNGLCQATCNLFWPQPAEPKEVGIPACAQQVDPLRLGGVGSSTPGRNNRASRRPVGGARGGQARIYCPLFCCLRRAWLLQRRQRRRPGCCAPASGQGLGAESATSPAFPGPGRPSGGTPAFRCPGADRSL